MSPSAPILLSPPAGDAADGPGKQQRAFAPAREEEPAAKRAKADDDTEKVEEGEGSLKSAGLKSDPRQAGLMSFFKKPKPVAC